MARFIKQSADMFEADEFKDLVLNAQKQLAQLKNPYVGNKRQIVGDIAIALQERIGEYYSVVDLFGGSSVVSILFKLINKQVTTNELLKSSYYNAVSFVHNSNIRLSREEIAFLCENKPHDCSFVTNRFKDRFTERESMFLDDYRSNIDIMFPDDLSGKFWIKRALAFITIEHFVMDHCFIGGRLNKGQILAELNHRLDHNRNRGKEMKFDLGTLPIFAGDGKAYNMDADEFLKIIKPEADLIYLDPPYGGQQSDYSSMFSFCEEYVHLKPLEEIDYIANSKKFASKANYEEQFQQLLQNASYFPCFAISYNNSSWADIDKIKAIISQFKQNIEVIEISHKYKYRDNKSGKPKAKEYLIIAR